MDHVIGCRSTIWTKPPPCLFDREGLVSVARKEGTRVGTPRTGSCRSGPIYLELIAVVDHGWAQDRIDGQRAGPLSERSPLTRLPVYWEAGDGRHRRGRQVGSTWRWRTSCARPRTARRPRWRVAGIERALKTGALPFFVQWRRAGLSSRPAAAEGHATRRTSSGGSRGSEGLRRRHAMPWEERLGDPHRRPAAAAHRRRPRDSPLAAIALAVGDRRARSPTRIRHAHRTRSSQRPKMPRASGTVCPRARPPRPAAESARQGRASIRGSACTPAPRPTRWPGRARPPGGNRRPWSAPRGTPGAGRPASSRAAWRRRRLSVPECHWRVGKVAGASWNTGSPAAALVSSTGSRPTSWSRSLGRCARRGPQRQQLRPEDNTCPLGTSASTASAGRRRFSRRATGVRRHSRRSSDRPSPRSPATCASPAGARPRRVHLGHVEAPASAAVLERGRRFAGDVLQDEQ